MAQKNTHKRKIGLYDANEIASYVIYIATGSPCGEFDEADPKEPALGRGIVHTKLQKILYFLQGYHLFIEGKPLFRNKIEAWTYGPVVPAVYEKYKNKRYTPLFKVRDDTNIDKLTKSFIRSIWLKYGDRSTGFLVRVTHMHDVWRKALKRKDKTITPTALKAFFEE